MRTTHICITQFLLFKFVTYATRRLKKPIYWEWIAFQYSSSLNANLIIHLFKLTAVTHTFYNVFCDKVSNIASTNWENNISVFFFYSLRLTTYKALYPYSIYNLQCRYIRLLIFPSIIQITLIWNSLTWINSVCN